MDGTLLDSARDFIAILQQMRQQRQLPPMPDELIRQQVSKGAAVMVSTALEVSPQAADFEQLKAQFLDSYRKHNGTHTRLFSELAPLLELLQQNQIPWGVATNKPEHFARPIMRMLQLEQDCSLLVCPEDVAHSKPAPDMLLLACHKLGLQPEQAIYIGDDVRDIQAANAAGMPSIAVGYGYHSPDDNPANWNATYFVAQAAELLPLLRPLLSVQES